MLIFLCEFDVWFWEEVDEWFCYIYYDLGCLYDIFKFVDFIEFEKIY